MNPQQLIAELMEMGIEVKNGKVKMSAVKAVLAAVTEDFGYKEFINNIESARLKVVYSDTEANISDPNNRYFKVRASFSYNEPKIYFESDGGHPVMPKSMRVLDNGKLAAEFIVKLAKLSEGYVSDALKIVRDYEG